LISRAGRQKQCRHRNQAIILNFHERSTQSICGNHYVKMMTLTRQIAAT
jgi:hypothetical protein